MIKGVLRIRIAWNGNGEGGSKVRIEAGCQTTTVTLDATAARSLAQRSVQAAKQIKVLLQDTIAQFEQCNRQVADASQTMRAEQQVNALMADMTQASREQSNGIVGVNRSVVDMDTNAQQNAAMVEQVAAAAGSLDEQAVRLTQAISIFKLGRAVPAKPWQPRLSSAPVARPISLAGGRVGQAFPIKTMTLLY